MRRRRRRRHGRRRGRVPLPTHEWSLQYTRSSAVSLASTRFGASVACICESIRALSLARSSIVAARAHRVPRPHLCGGASSIAAVRSSCAFRAALPASGTNRRCGQCVYGGECARHERRLSRVRDIKVLEGGTIRRVRRPRCHGAARAWRAREHEPGERQWAQRSDRPSMNAQGGTTSGSNESAAEGRALRP